MTPGAQRGATWPAWRTVAAVAALAAAVLGVYTHSLRDAFVFDDRYTIVSNDSLGDFSHLSSVLFGVRGSPTGGRPLTSLSLNLNALVAGRDPAGFRTVNVLIHLAAAMVLLALLRRVFAATPLRSPVSTAAEPLAFAATLLWAVHPLATESVTYISQRAESLMGLNFLLAVYLAVRGFAEERPAPWFRGASVAAVLAALSKEVGVMAPLVILLYDGAVVSKGLRRAVSRHRALYAGLSLSWVAAALLQLGAPRGSSVSFTSPEIGPLAYLSRQPGALLTYIKVAFWPSPLIFDYGDPPPPVQPATLVVFTVVVLAILAAACLGLRRFPLVGFAGVSFFLILAPTAVIPIVTEVIAEHRTYLPLACLVGVVVAGAATSGRRLLDVTRLSASVLTGVGWVVLWAAAFGLGTVAWQRNTTYRSALTLWADTVAKVPENPRALGNYGMALYEAGRASEALTQFRRALAIHPEDFHVNGGMALALESLGQPAEALAYMRRAVELNPSSSNAHAGVVRLSMKLGRWDEAIGAARNWVETFPGDADANAAYGSLLVRMGRAGEAAPYLRRARELAAGARPR